MAEQARLRPEAVAVIGPDETLTYGELVHRATQLAHTLRRLGAGKEIVTALLLERSAGLVTGALAALQTGGAYLPIDPAQPADRVLHILRDAGPAALVTTSAQLRRLPGLPLPAGSVLLLDEPLPPGDDGPLPEVETGPDSLAYVIYTSGSTGPPKGTELAHRGLSHICDWHVRAYGVTPGDRGALLAGPGFDASVWDMWPPLTAGGSLRVPPADTVRNPPALLRWLADHGITTAFIPTPTTELMLQEPPPPGIALRNLLTGGDRLHRRPPAGLPYNLVNHYGPTETTIVITAGVVPPEDGRGLVPDLGELIEGNRVHILGPDQRPVPEGTPGELCISGPGLARCYRRRPDLTAASFIPDPFSDAPGGRLYRSGDLVRRLDGGGLGFLGRIDRQIKIRGYRIELGEIEDALARQRGVRESTVLVRPGEDRLTAYVVLHDREAGADPAAARKSLREAVARALPEIMVPTAWAFLEALPLNQNGKVDRKVLERIEPEAAVGAETAEAPRTSTEQLVAGAFAQILDLPAEPGRGDDFFHLGGHSLLANRVAFRLRELFGVAPDLARIFESATVESLAAWIDEALRQDAPQVPPPEPAERTGPAPLSFAQESLWFLDRLQPGMATYNLAYVSAFPGRIGLAALAGALREVLRRHEALRTGFSLPPGAADPVQTVAEPDALPWALPVADLGALPADARDAEAERLVQAEARRPYDLPQAPLLRALLIRQGDVDQLFLGMHHIVSDGWSMGVLHRELSALYRAAAEGAASPLPEPPLQIADFALWQKRWLTGERLDSRLAWWRDRLEGAPPVLELPADRPRPAVPSQRGAVEELALGAPLERGLLEKNLAGFGRSRGATPFMVLLAAFQALLRRYTGQADFLVGSPAANRSWDALEGTIGYFVNLLPLRAELADDPPVGELVVRVRAGALGAFAHQDLPFERLVGELAPDRDLSHSPLVQIVLALQEELPPLDFGPGLAARPAALPTGTAKMDLALFVERREDGYTALAEYATDLFDAATIRRLLESFRTLLAAALAAPDLRVAELPLLRDGEREQVLAAAAGPAAEIPELPIHELVAAQARRQPEAPAVDDGAESLTYRELVRRATELGHTLRGLGAGPEKVVALLLERSAGLAVSALATLGTGGAYLPIDPAQPADRILYLLRDSGATALVTTAHHRGALAELPLPESAVLLLDALPAVSEIPAVPGFRHGPEALAYVIYTSGSTGLPKGTELRHQGLSNLSAWHQRAYGLTAADRCTLLAGPGFDASVWELWPALSAGASLHVPPPDVVRSPPALVGWLAERRISVAFLPTPLAEAVLAERGLADAMRADLPLRFVLTGGDRLRRRPPAGLPFVLVNHYGPTESAVVATAGAVAPAAVDSAPGIGAAIDNFRVTVLDSTLRPQPEGVPGELCIAGPGLARGYRRRPDLTAASFVPDPWAPEPGGRLYRTGDLVRRRAGALEFLGRIDRQVKIRGFRIELGEIEATLAAHSEVRECAVLVRPGESRLSAYVVPRDQERGDLRETLREALSRSLPEPMVPSAWRFLEALPLTTNGKVDRRVLERLEPAGLAQETPALAPRTPTEQLLAGLFAEILGLDAEPGTRDSFFHLGGNSLLATRLASRIREVWSVDLGVARIFERATVEHLAARIDEAVIAGEPQAPPPAPAMRSNASPLSFAQQRLWFLDRYQPESAAYNIAQACALGGTVDATALGAALREIVRRHEALRTRFEMPLGESEPVQVAVDPATLPALLSTIDLRGLPVSAQRAAADRAAADEARRSWDLGAAPLLRAILVRLGNAPGDGDRLLLGMHHIVSDGWSMGVLLHELSILYRAAVAGTPSQTPLPELPLQYADYALWQRSWMAGEGLEARLRWWRDRLEGAPAVLEIPADRPRPPVASGRGALESVPLGADLAEPLAAFGRRHGSTLFMTLLAAFQALLHRCTGQDDLLVGSPVANRQWAQLEGLIGFFVNLLPLRADLAGAPGFAELVGRVREGALGAYAHQDLPFERLVEELAPERDLSRSPLVQVVFAMPETLPPLDLGPGLTSRATTLPTGTARLDLAVLVESREEGLVAVVEHALDLFDRETVHRLLGTFRVLLQGALEDPERPVSELPLLDAAQRVEVLAAGAGPVQKIPHRLVHQQAAEQARLRPDALAVDDGEERLTYAELTHRAASLAATLRRLGAGPETLVALLLERSAGLVTAALATLRAGAAYLPIDPALPIDRVLHMLGDSGARVLVTTAERRSQLAGLAPSVLAVLDLHDVAAAAEEPAELEVSGPGPDDLAYCIYTSGSTGLPKGTDLRHGGLASLCAWHLRTYGLTAEDRCGLIAGPGFDASVWETWAALTAGASLHVPPAGLVRTPPALLGWMAVRRITVAFLPTPLAEAVLAEPMPADLALRFLFTGGDRLHRRPPSGLPFTLINLYGPTESTVVTTAGPVLPEGEGVPDIGVPIANFRVHVLDRALQPVPPGMPGELCFAGAGLARGYRRRPDLTARAFVPDPWSAEPGARLYRTGDLVRRLAGGSLEFLGRIDRQVKIRGFRIELGEIEAALDRLPAVREAAVLVRPGESRLTAYVVARDADPSGLRESLREALARTLPEAMVPAAWVFLDALPLTPNGKVDRRALERIEAADAGAGEPEAPRTPVEQLLAALFAQVLGLDAEPGIHDSFFHLGGHSLIATQLAARIQGAFGVEIPLRTVFESPTVALLAELVGAAGRPAAPPLRPAERGPEAELSFAQQRLWFLHRFDTGSIAYNIPVLFRIDGPDLRPAALAAALDEVVRRHEALRTVFRGASSGGVQVIQPFVPRELPLVDLSGLPEEVEPAEASRLALAEANTVFDLSRGPLLRTWLLRRAPQGETARHDLFVHLHHIVADGWSLDVLAREVSGLYRAFAAGEPSPLPALPVQYADFALWQREWLSGEALEAELAWWRGELAGLPPTLDLPADRPRPAVQSYRGTTSEVRIGPETGDRLAELSRRRGATLFMTLLAAFGGLLHRYTGEEDLAVGAPVAGRDRPEIQGLIGFFVNTLVLRLGFKGDPTFLALADRARRTALEAYAHQDIPFEKLVAELSPGRNLAHAPLVQVSFSVREAPPLALELGSGLTGILREVRHATAKLDLSFDVTREDEGQVATCEYTTDLFDAATIENLLGHWHALLQGITAAPETHLSSLPLLTAPELEQLLIDQAGGPAAEPEAATLHGLVAAQARRTPEAVALIFRHGREVDTITYAQLAARARALAGHLRPLGAGPEVRVALCADRTPDLVIGLLGILESGAAAVPLDLNAPPERLAMVLEDSAAVAVVTTRELAVRLPAVGVAVERVFLDEIEARGDVQDAMPAVQAENLAYVIFTSGSTGRPKGVAVSHGAVVEHCVTIVASHGLSGRDRVLQFASPAFDASLEEIFPPLAVGAAVVLQGADLCLPADLLRLVSELELSVLDLRLSYLQQWIRASLHEAARPASLRLVIAGGEEMRSEVARQWLATPLASGPSGVPLINAYGPTEAVITATVHRVAPGRLGQGSSVPIGRPLPGRSARVLDARGNALPVGAPGELSLGGTLARGYLGRPDLTAERFVPDPFAKNPGTRLYRTGDLVRRLNDRSIEFLGRLDDQVKIRGFRIEPGEIEAVLAAHPAVTEAAVLPRRDGREIHLVAYLEAPGLSAGEVRDWLKQRLPAYMVPSDFVLLDRMPKTTSEKIDRRALARIEPARPGANPSDPADAPVELATPTERALAALWSEVLGVEWIGRQDDFFLLGGHSLLAMQLVSQVRDRFGLEMGLRAVFEESTLARMAALIDRSGGSGAHTAQPEILMNAGREGSGAAPLSFPQQRLWFLDRLQQGSPAYNLPVRLGIDGPLSVPTLSAAVTEIVRRHAALRTVFATDPTTGEPVQVATPPERCELPVVDLSALPAAARESETERQAVAAERRLFDLERGPLLRTVLLRQGPASHLLVATMHHIVSDGWSIQVLQRELLALYAAFADGLPSPLPELPLQYVDFAVWQRQRLAGEALEQQLGWWRERLAGKPPTLDLPADHPRPAVQSLRGGIERLPLPAGLAEGAEQLGRAQGTTLFMTLLAVFQALLSRYTGQEDLWIGSPVSNRDRSEIEGLIGFFVNTLVLRTDLSGEPGFIELLARVRETSLGAFAHQELPFEKLVEEIAPRRDLSRSPLFQAFFSEGAGAGDPVEIAPGTTLTPRESPGSTAKFDLSLAGWRDAGRLVVGAEYSSDLFEPETVRRLLGHFGVLLEGALAEPLRPISDLPLLRQEEAVQIALWNEGTRRAPAPPAVLHGLFEAQAERTPEAIALVAGGHALTYRELERRSAALARRLRRLGVGPEVPVAVCLERTTDLVVALLGVLRAGGFYVPLDPAHPADRLAFLLEDSRCQILLAGDRIDDLPEPPGAAALRLPVHQTIDEAVGEEAGGRVKAPVEPGHLAYLIYTSGSTGRPKAVAIEHRSAVAMVRWAREVFSAEELAGVVAPTSVTFDLSVFEIFVPLAVGGTVILVDNAVAVPALNAPGALPDGIEPRLINTVPSAIDELLRLRGLPPSVRTVNLAGEALSRALADRVYERPETERLFNLYGPSEDTTYSAFARIERSGRRTPPIGQPVDDTRAYVVDRRMRLLPAGVPGELCLAGAGLARGYLRRPELTADRFLPDPFAGEPGARLYRTGDLVRRRPDGALEYLGRIDHQVKIRGFRIELGEVEAALASLPGVAAAVALAREGSPGDKRLVAYLVHDGKEGQAMAAEIRDALRSLLPEAMIPSSFVFLEALPLSPNGKVDRKALAAIEPERLGEGEPEEPATLTERALAALWSEILEISRIGRRDDFFLLGGHSLLAMRLVSRVRSRFGAELGLRAVFEESSLARMAAHIDGLTGRAAGPQLRAGLAGDGPAPLSFPQQRLWFLDRLQQGSSAYNLPVRFRIDGPLSVSALAAAFTEIVRRHAALRTVFALDPASGEPVQRAMAPEPCPLPVVDLSALPVEAGEVEAELQGHAAERRLFDLGRGPLLRVLLVRQAAGSHLLVAAMHHIVSDGWSIGVLLRELRALYGAFADGVPSPLPEIPLQYADFAAWQRQRLAGGALEPQLGWWRGQLAGEPPTLDLPADHPRPAVQTLRGGIEQRALPPGLAEGVEQLGRRQGTTLFMTLLAVFQTLLHRYTGQEDLWIGTPVSNRDHSEIEGLIGFFVNTLVLRTDLSGEPAFLELLARVRETSLGAFAHQELPFEKLVEEIAPRRDLSRSPLFQAFFSVMAGGVSGAAGAGEPLELAPGIALTLQESPGSTAKFDLSLACWKDAGRLVVGAEYSSDLFEVATVQRLLGHFAVLLEGIVAEPRRAVADLPLLSAGETAQIALWNQRTRRAPASPEVLHGLFEAQAERTPEAIALVAGGHALTYRELERRSAALAHRLRRLGIGPEVPVAVCLERTADLVVALLGVLRAGGFYVPLDPAHPADRLAFLLEDSRCRVLLAGRRIDDLPDTGALRLRVDEAIAEAASAGPLEEAAVAPGHLAYLIYTSGSTGRPKAVAIEHRSAVAMVRWARGVFSAEELAGVVSPTSVTFDLSVFEIFVPLAVGGTVILVDNALAVPALNAPGALPDGVEPRLINTVPSAIDELLRLRGLPPSVRTVNLAGEALSRALADRVYERPGTERLFNLYGPSEDTTYSTFARIDRAGRRAPSIGQPVDDTRSYVVDRRMRLLPVGVPGELCLAGAGLARGYLRRPELTADRFLPDPFADEPGARLYRTGDLARRRPDGTLEYLGRIDHQVKIRGFRIELGEVEAALQSFPGVVAAVALAREDAPGGKRLVAYVVMDDGEGREEQAAAEIRAALRGRLPEVMIPSAFVFLESLPLSPNGKVDRKALPAPPAQGAGRQGAEVVAPRTSLEQGVAEIWQAVLGAEGIGIHDSFWDLGGHSLLATKVLLRVSEEFGVELPLQSLFASPKLNEFAELVGQSVLAAQGDDMADLLAEIDGLSEEEIRELLAHESEVEELT